MTQPSGSRVSAIRIEDYRSIRERNPDLFGEPHRSNVPPAPLLGANPAPDHRPDGRFAKYSLRDRQTHYAGQVSEIFLNNTANIAIGLNKAGKIPLLSTITGTVRAISNLICLVGNAAYVIFYSLKPKDYEVEQNIAFHTA